MGRGDVGQFRGWFNGLLKTFQNCLSGTDRGPGMSTLSAAPSQSSMGLTQDWEINL